MRDDAENKIAISLYEFYAMGINTLLVKAPWEKGERVSAYHESFLYEQRLLGLTMLLLLGEEYVPKHVLKTMNAKFKDQVRISVNLAVFKRALKHHFRQLASGDEVVEQMLNRMESYIVLIRETEQNKEDPIEAITMILARRVPPKSQEQYELYLKRVESIFDFTESLVRKSLNEKYEIVEM
jgi:hypothetical protein